MMRLIKILIVLLIIGGIFGGGGYSGYRYMKARNQPSWRTAAVTKGTIKESVNATGEVKPVLRVTVGSFVSGPIADLFVDFNDRVEKDQILARVDPRLYQAAVGRDRAGLATQQAEVQRVKALLQQARNEEARLVKLREASPDFVSDTETDQATFNRMSLEAQLTVAEANVEQAKANLENSETNLAYTDIRAPVAGIVIDRKIDDGQTIAAQFQTPELFVLAPDMDQRIHIYASVDEADIGLVRRAQAEVRPVTFTVDAYPDELFSGSIYQVRLSSEENQNVITYPVIVEAPNQDLKLLPGMTATLSFQIQELNDVLRIPNAALRFYPEKAWVHPDDQKILAGIEEDNNQDLEGIKQSAEDRSASEAKRKQRHVWYADGPLLRARPVKIGVSDSRYSTLVEGDLEEGMLLVTARDTSPAARAQ